MIITAQDLDLLTQIEFHSEKCIRACLYAKATSDTDNNMWRFTQNCFAESAILHWCKIFGSHEEPTHYTQFFNGKCFKMENGTLLSMEIIRSRLCKSAGMTEDEYLLFWKNLKKGRDQYFIHNEFAANSRAQFPDLDLLKKMALEMRDIIHEIISQEESEDIEKYKLFRDHMQWNRNQKYLGELQNDCGRFREIINLKK